MPKLTPMDFTLEVSLLKGFSDKTYDKFLHHPMLAVETKSKKKQLIVSKPQDALVYAGLCMYYTHLSGVTMTPATTLNSSASNMTSTMMMYVNSPIGTSIYGTQVGGSSTAVASSNWSLGTLYSHGTSASALYYGIGDVGIVVDSAAQSLLTVTRVFMNYSGSTITVEECGLVGWSGSAVIAWLMNRDLTGSVPILTGEGIVVTYNNSFDA